MVSRYTPQGVVDAVYMADPQSGAPLIRNTYVAAFSVVPAATATDVVEIIGAAGKRITVQYIEVTGTAAATLGFQFLLNKRSALNTGGSSTNQTETPTNSINASTGFATPACSATVKAYTANPSGLGALVGTVGSYLWTILSGSSTTFRNPNIVNMGLWSTPITLNSATETLCVNLAGAATVPTRLDFVIVLTEE